MFNNMLSNFFFTRFFFQFCQNGFYYDYICKKISEQFVRNNLIYSAQFFGEKYMIEFLTKYFFIHTFKTISIRFNLSLQYYSLFFYNIVGAFCLFFIFTNIMFLLF